MAAQKIQGRRAVATLPGAGNMQCFRAPGYMHGPLKAGLSGEAARAQSLLLCARTMRGFELFTATQQMGLFKQPERRPLRDGAQVERGWLDAV